MITEETEDKFIYIYVCVCVYVYNIGRNSPLIHITGGKEWHSCYRQSLFFDFSISLKCSICGSAETEERKQNKAK